MSEKIEPKVGQIWESNDWRARASGRAAETRFRIDEVLPHGVVVRNISGLPRPRTILTRRLRPNSTGYRLVQEAP